MVNYFYHSLFHTVTNELKNNNVKLVSYEKICWLGSKILGTDNLFDNDIIYTKVHKLQIKPIRQN